MLGLFLEVPTPFCFCSEDRSSRTISQATYKNKHVDRNQNHKCRPDMVWKVVMAIVRLLPVREVLRLDGI